MLKPFLRMTKNNNWLVHLKKILAFFLNNRNFVAWKKPKIPKKCSFLWNAAIAVYV